ncbi:MAG: hypothetical protein IPI10_02310 [Bacteroidetes bacterium]|nr:hypothetical protein [Bacteroidota bacterium]
MKITTTRLPIILIVVFFLFNFSKSLAQAGIGLPYGFGVTPTSTNITGATTINLTIRPVAIQDEMDTLDQYSCSGYNNFWRNCL